MNSFERVMTVLRKGIPDRVPVFEWVIDKNVIEAICPGGDQGDLVEELDLDAIVVPQDEIRERINDTTYRDEWGVIKKQSGQAYAMQIQYPLVSRSDIERYRPPDPEAAYRFDSLKQAVERFKGKKAIIIKLRDVFSQPRDLRGFEQLLIDCALDQELVTDLVEISVSYFGRLAERAIELGADIIHTGDDIADNHGPFFSPQLYKEIFYPQFKKLVQRFHSTGAPYIKHSDGYLWPILDLLVDSGLDMLDPIDPLAGMDIALVKKRYGNQIGIKGNVDCAGVLQYGTPEDVAAATRACIHIASPGGGHVLSSSNSIHSGIPAHNFIAMVEAVHRFGQYPIGV